MKVLFIYLFLSTFIYSQDIVTHKLAAGENIRSISEKYLDNPNLWKDILNYNKISSLDKLTVGITLEIPVKSIKNSENLISEANKNISEATEIGARIFAKAEIEDAISKYEDAIKKREGGNFSESISLAKISSSLSKKAADLSSARRDKKVEAILTSKKGKVENKKNTATLWIDAKLNQKMLEGERVRTLSGSIAEITFHDGNRIRLNENALAEIQKMRVDLMNNSKEAKVNLVEGEAFALLTGRKSVKNFDMNIKGVKSNFDSKKFWVNKTKNETKIANYDGEIKLESDGKVVVVKENQGVKVDNQNKISIPKTLLAKTLITNPQNNFINYNEFITIEWEKVKDAVSYKIEISKDKDFTDIVMNSSMLKSPSYKFQSLTDGSYYVRVSAVDNEGFPGDVSNSVFFRNIIDKTPPYIRIDQPENNSFLMLNSVTIVGITENDADVKINGTVVKNIEGRFSYEMSLAKGDNVIEIISKDKAGNFNQTKLNLNYDDSKNYIEIEKSKIVNNRFVNISGITLPESLVIVYLNEDIVVKAYADKSGKFSLNFDTQTTKGLKAVSEYRNGSVSSVILFDN